MVDNINSPSHYTSGNIECIDAMQSCLSKEEFKGFLRGNIFKYIWRSPLKNGMPQDFLQSFLILGIRKDLI